MSGGGFCRASVRRDHALPPLWVGRCRQGASAVPRATEPPQIKIAELDDLTADRDSGGEGRAAAVTSGAGSAKVMDPANARQCHAHAAIEAVRFAAEIMRPIRTAPKPPERIPLPQSASAMDQSHARAAKASAARVSQLHVATGLALCKCGAGRAGFGAVGPVPQRFGRASIEAQGP